MAEITETELPGIGVRREFTTRGGMRLGVIAHRTGSHDLLLYDREDPDVCRAVIPLDEPDSDLLADLLGGNRIRGDAASTLVNLEGLAIDWVNIDPESEVAGMTIGEIDVRTRTGATVAAIIDGDRSLPGPGPEARLPAGAVVVAVGTPEAIQRMEDLLANPSS